MYGTQLRSRIMVAAFSPRRVFWKGSAVDAVSGPIRRRTRCSWFAPSNRSMVNDSDCISISLPPVIFGRFSDVSQYRPAYTNGAEAHPPHLGHPAPQLATLWLRV